MGGLTPPLFQSLLDAARCVLLRLVLLCLSFLALPAWALTPEQAARIAAGDSDDRIKALNETVAAADVGLGPFLQAVLADEVKVAGGKAYVVRDGKAVEAGTNAAATLPDGAEDVVNNNRMRREMESALAALALFSPDRALAREGDRRSERPGRRRQARAARKSRGAGGRCGAESPTRRAEVGGADLVDRQGQARRRRQGAGREPRAGHTIAAARAPGRRERSAGEGGDPGLARRGAVAPGVGRAPRPAVHRREPGFDPAAGRTRPGDHLRPDGRDQHGARRADDDRRLRDLRGAEPVQGLSARRLRCLCDRRDPDRVSHLGAGRRDPRAQRDPLALRPAARNAAGHLGHQPGADAGGALDLRRAERRRREPVVAVGRRAGAAQPHAAVQPHRDPGVRGAGAGRHGAG